MMRQRALMLGVGLRRAVLSNRICDSPTYRVWCNVRVLLISANYCGTLIIWI